MRNHWLRLVLTVCALICPALAYAQEGNFQTILLSGGGIPIPGAKVAVCSTGLTTTAASVTNNIATLTMSSNPITAGFLATKTLTVSGFTGGDTYFNVTATVVSVTATTISYALTHANASAGTNGKAFQTGDATTACAPLSSLFTDDTGTVAAANPTTSDSLGNVSIWALPASYNVQYYGGNVPLKVVEMSIGLPGSVPVTVTTLTVTGAASIGGPLTPCSIAGLIYVTNTGCYTTLAQAFIGCPVGPSACIIDMRGASSALALGTFNPGNIAVTLYLGPYTYTINQITVQPNFRMFGTNAVPGINSAPATVLNATGGNAVPPIVLAQVCGVSATLADFNLVGTGGNTSQNGINLIAPNCGGLWYSQFSNIDLSGFAGISFNLDSQINGSIHQFSTFSRIVAFRPLNGNFALQIIGRANSLVFDNCEFDGTFNTQDGLTNINIAQGSNTVGVPYNITFNLLTDQYAGVGVLVNGADSVSINQPHFEAIQGVLSTGTGSSFGPMNITMHDGGAFTNSGIGTVGGVGIGNGYIVNNRAATGNAAIQIISFHSFNTPDNFFIGNQGSISNFGNTIGPQGSYTFVTPTHGGLNLALRINSGTAALGTGTINAATCATVVTVVAGSVASTDSIAWSFNAAPPATYSGLTVAATAGTGSVNFYVCNPTAGNITPAAATLNWRVLR